MTVVESHPSGTTGGAGERPVQPPGRPGTPDRARRGVRGDIQALRAAAVSMVLLYHLWPDGVTGGFTGVDVFFVISGFLITTHLLAHPPARGRDLLAFWSRRIRRLLPASLLVLTVTLVSTRLFAPETVWESVASQIRAAALYVVNWRLADDSVDYLASQDAPTPVQHFWSLSVEEQFYLVWPILILVLVAAARLLRRRSGSVVTGGLAVVVALSLAYSVAETAAEPARAYFVTPTRVWELGAGGLIASVVAWRASGGFSAGSAAASRLNPSVRTGVAWLGWAVLLVTALTFTGAMPFPSYTAALPVVGAMLVIIAEARPGRLSPDRFTRLRPIQWLGDVSYSVYLWHWPLLVLLPSVLGHALTPLDKVGVIVAALGLAFLTKRYVEDRFRTAAWGRPLLKPFALAAAAMLLVVGMTELQSYEVDQRAAAAQQQVAAKLAHPTACFGAAALAAPPGRCPETRSGPLYPAPLQAAKAKPAAWDVVDGRNCFAHSPSYALVSCTHGSGSARLKVALIGNSHAGQWYTSMEAVADAQHWRVTTYLASQCALTDTLQHLATPAESAGCLAWGRAVQQRVLHGGYDLVVMANRVSVTAEGSADKASSLAAYQAGYAKVLQRFAQARLRVVILRDTPAPGDGNPPGFSIPDCLAAHPTDYTACSGPRSTWLPADPSVTALKALHDPRQQVLDLTDLFCGPTVCPAVVGQVPVYFDASHMTRTYGRTLAPYLGARLKAALGS